MSEPVGSGGWWKVRLEGEDEDRSAQACNLTVLVAAPTSEPVEREESIPLPAPKRSRRSYWPQIAPPGPENALPSVGADGDPRQMGSLHKNAVHEHELRRPATGRRCTATPELSIVTDFLHNLMKDTILGRAEVRRVLAEVDRRVQEHAASQARDRVLADANSPAKRKKP